MKLLSETFIETDSSDFRILDLNYKGKLISVEILFFPDFYENQSFLDQAAQFLPNLEQYLPTVISSLHLDLENNAQSWAAEYCVYYLDEASPEELAETFPDTPLDRITPAFLIDNLAIHGMHLWVNQDNLPFLTIDFVINSDYSDELLVVHLNLDGELVGITWES